MSTLEPHPPWCNPTRCTVGHEDIGVHESSPARITGGQGSGKQPRILLVLQAPPTGHPVKIRMVTISDMLINTLDIDLPAAAMLSARLNWMIGQANGPEG